MILSDVTPFSMVLTYDEICQQHHFPSILYTGDHLGGFSKDLKNPMLEHVAKHAPGIQIFTYYLLDKTVQSKYANLRFAVMPMLWVTDKFFDRYNMHPDNKFIKFLCSFNGSSHVSRKFLVAALHRWHWFDPDGCSKNFQFTVDELDGHLADYLDHDTHRYHRTLFIGNNSVEFFDSIYSFGHVQYDHAQNIHNLEHKLTQSFLHIVSETLATSYYPFVTEKFLYSVVTRGLFLAYAQPGWHEHVERYYGFRRYTKLFDYRFDSIQNPVERLVELMSMISKFSVLSSDDWLDLYNIESDTIEHNYDHYFSKNYIKHLEQFV